MRKARSSARAVLAIAVLVAAGWVAADAGVVKPEGGGESSAKASVRTGGPQDMGQERTVTPPAQAGESGSAADSAERAAEERQLSERVRKRWEALVKRDFATAYTYETPEYRKENSVQRFGAQFGSLVRWHMATVKEVRYDREDEATVKIMLDYSFDLPTDETARTTSVIREQWVRIDDSWWHRDERHPLGGGNQSQPSQRK